MTTELPIELVKGGIVQYLYAEHTTMETTTNSIPFDTTIPQSTEGIEILTLSITPKKSTNRLIINTNVYTSASSNYYHISALFKDSETDATAVASMFDNSSGAPQPTLITYEMVAGTTSEITFRVRASTNGGTCTFNGINGASRMGGTLRNTITIQEISV